MGSKYLKKMRRKQHAMGSKTKSQIISVKKQHAHDVGDISSSCTSESDNEKKVGKNNNGLFSLHSLKD